MNFVDSSFQFIFSSYSGRSSKKIQKSLLPTLFFCLGPEEITLPQKKGKKVLSDKNASSIH